VSSNVHEILSMLDSLSRLPMARRYRHISSAILLASAGLLSVQTLRAQAPAVPQQTPPPSAISIVPLQTAPASGEPLTLEAAFARALTSNPLIAAARLKRAINLAGVEVAGERPNPDAHVEIEKETPKQDFGVALPIELGGKRGRRVAVAQATLATGEAELGQTIVEIRSLVRRAYFSRLIAEARFSILDELRQFATRARDAAQARFDVGSAPRLEPLQAQLALAAAENEMAGAQATAQAARIQLNALLGLPLDANVPLATALDAAPTLVVAAALQLAQASNAELAVLERQIVQARAKVALAQALRTPDVTPDVTVTHNSMPDFMWGWRVAALATIPVFTSHRAAVRVEEATLAQLNAQHAAVLARVTGDVTSASALAEAERLTYVRYRDEILPQTQEVERMAEDSYRLGQTGIAALLQALQQSRQVRLQSLQTASDLQTALSDLERAIGAPIP
jgi:cobalt-zinc-cadmium efflux system outer membrane protein